MSKKIIKPLVLSVLFLAALIVFEITTNQDNQDLTTSMAEATLPIVEFYQGDNSVAQLHGYVSAMDQTAMRDTIIPIDSERILPMQISSYGKSIDAVSYEIRSLDGDRLVAKNDITDYEKSGQTISASLAIQNILEKDEEYEFIVTLTSDEQEIYYYARLMQTDDLYTKECMDFALEFHDYTFREDADTFIPTYMDAATGDTSSLHYTDLSCTLRQITWADLSPVQLSDTYASFKEINDSYNVVTINYVMTAEGSGGETEYYNVEEYYRLRMTETRMYVLNFERTTNEIFRGENDFITDSRKIQLGIRDGDIEYASSETGDVIAFVQEGELWCYDRLNSKIVKVFSFLDTEGIDQRSNWDQHDIKIAGVDEAGSIDFVVYGYMNRGDHEGEVGTAVYHYDGIVQTVEEEVFIPSNQSYEVLKAEMGQLMYVSEQGVFYLVLDKQLYGIDLNSLTTNILVRNLKENCYQVSDSNRYFAWVPGDEEYESDTINLMDLSDGSTYEIKEDDTYALRPLGFIGDDFIYGAAKRSKVVVGAAGNTVFPMSYLKIMGTSEGTHDILKEYTPTKGKISSISVESYTIYVNLIKKSGGRYIASGDDTIMNREAEGSEKVAVETTVTDRKETQYQLTLKSESDSSKIKLITAKAIILEEEHNIELNFDSEQERFYVYEKGDVVLATDDITSAVISANENQGVVVGSRQNYVWMRARKTAQNPFSGLSVNSSDKSSTTVIQAVSALLNYHGENVSVKSLTDSGETPKSAMESTLQDSVVLDLSGCTTEELLFYVSEGSPVFAMTASESAVLITGYNSSRIYYYDPSSDTTLSKSLSDADEWFEKAGNIFFTYLDN